MTDLDDLIKSVDIVEYISQFVELEEKNGEFWGLSPFKDEKTPSFSVRRETGSFFDFSSGIAGNILTFIRYYFNCSRRESFEKLKAYAGFEGKVYAPREKMDATRVCKLYQRQKTNEKAPAVSQFQQDCMLRYEKNDEKLAGWEREGISRASLDKYEVYYDSFANRLVYPIRNLAGEIVNIGGRTLDPDWKSKEIRKYNYYAPWGKMTTVYGLYENRDAIKNRKEVIIFEGVKSVFMADTWGIHNCAALLTSHLSPFQMRALAKLGCRVVFALDKEVDITKDHNISKLRQYVNVEYIRDVDGLLDEKDAPVDKGKETFLRLYEKRQKFR